MLTREYMNAYFPDDSELKLQSRHLDCRAIISFMAVCGRKNTYKHVLMMSGLGGHWVDGGLCEHVSRNSNIRYLQPSLDSLMARIDYLGWLYGQWINDALSLFVSCLLAIGVSFSGVCTYNPQA